MTPQDQPWFPSELIIRIFISLDCASLVRCRAISKQVKAIVDTIPELQYKIELHVAGFVDNPQYLGNVTECLRLLREVQEARKRPAFVLDANVGSIDPLPGNGVRYHGDVLIYHSRQVPSPWQDGIRYYSELKCIHVQFAPDSPITRKWTLAFDFSFVTYAADPGRNLLALVTPGYEGFILRVCSLLDGSTLKEILLPHLTTHAMGLPLDLHICGDVIGVVAMMPSANDSPHAAITILNWKMGVITKPIECHNMKRPLVDFVFISESCFLLGKTREDSNAIEVYSMEDKIVMRHPDGGFSPVHIATYHLPPCRKGVSPCIQDFYWSFCSKLSDNACTAPFEAAPSSAMLQVLLVYLIEGREVGRGSFFIPGQVFINVSNTYRMQNGTGPVSLPWESWGPSSTRSDLDQWGIRAMYGSRVLASNYGGFIPDILLDFNQVDIARDLNRQQLTATGAISPSGSNLTLEVFSEQAELPDCSAIETELTIIHDEDIFVDDVVTRLPFRRTKIACVGPIPYWVFGGDPWISGFHRNVNNGLSPHNVLGL